MIRPVLAVRLVIGTLLGATLILVSPAGAESRTSGRVIADATATVRVHLGGIGGSVRIDPSPTPLSCSYTHCAYGVPDGAAVRLTATAEGSRLVRWEGACDQVRENRCYLRARGERWVSALFSPVQLDLVVNGPGSLQMSPYGDACAQDLSRSCRQLDYGVQVRIVADPDADAQFDGWSGDCRGSEGTTCTLRVTDNTHAEATFSSGDLTTTPSGRNTKFSLSLGGPGTGKVRLLSGGENGSCAKPTKERRNCKWFLRRGTQVTLKATGAGAARFKEWGGRCDEVAAPTCLVANVYNSQGIPPKVVAVFVP